jgi:hypothetical protein
MPITIIKPEMSIILNRAYFMLSPIS